MGPIKNGSQTMWFTWFNLSAVVSLLGKEFHIESSSRQSTPDSYTTRSLIMNFSTSKKFLQRRKETSSIKLPNLYRKYFKEPTWISLQIVANYLRLTMNSPERYQNSKLSTTTSKRGNNNREINTTKAALPVEVATSTEAQSLLKALTGEIKGMSFKDIEFSLASICLNFRPYTFRI